MDMNGIYQKDNKFDGEESLYYVLAGNGGSSRLSKNEKYHIITCSAVAIYDINADCVVKKIKIMTCVNYVLQWRSGLYLHGMCGKW